MRNRALIFCLCLACLGLSAFALRAEFHAQAAVDRMMIGDLSVGVSTPLTMPLSHSRRDALLLGCFAAIAPGPGDFLGRTASNQTHAHCAQFTDRAQRFWRSSGTIGLLRAAMAAQKQDIPLLAVELARAQRDAPNEGWQAIRRVALVAAQPDTTDQFGDTLAGLAGQDLRLLLKIQPGAEAVARHYVHAPQMRSAIGRALEEAAAKDVRRFFNLAKLEKLE